MLKSNEEKYNRGARTYLGSVVKAASHPIRNQILRSLKNEQLSTIELEEKVGESRYNLYHHLEVLMRADLINEVETSGKSKKYEMKIPSKPEAALVLFSEHDLKKNSAAWIKVLEGLEKIEGAKIPYKKRIKEVEIHIKY